MSPLKVAIFSEVRNNFDKSSPLTDCELNEKIFYHQTSLRLTKKGFLVIRNIFTPYIFELPDTMMSKHQMAMARMQYPYFIAKSNIVLFSEMDSVMVKLHGGIERFLEVCSQVD